MQQTDDVFRAQALAHRRLVGKRNPAIPALAWKAIVAILLGAGVLLWALVRLPLSFSVYSPIEPNSSHAVTLTSPEYQCKYAYITTSAIGLMSEHPSVVAPDEQARLFQQVAVVRMSLYELLAKGGFPKRPAEQCAP